MSIIPNVPTPPVVVESSNNNTIDLMTAILNALGVTTVTIYPKSRDTGDDLLYSIFLAIIGGGYTPGGEGGSRLLSGDVTWLHDLVFDITICVYVIGGTLYTCSAGQVTLDDGDATNDRIDVIYVDTDGNFGVKTGTPAPSPEKPVLDDPTNQLEVTFILVKAGATTADVKHDDVYLEHVEWTCSQMGSLSNAPDFDNLTAPQAGVKCIYCLNYVQNDSLLFDKGQIQSAMQFRYLRMYVKFDEYTAPGYPFKIKPLFRLGNSIVGSGVEIQNGLFGLNTAASGWQTIVVPISSFVFTNSLFDKLELQFSGIGTPSIYIDTIQFLGDITGLNRGMGGVQSVTGTAVDNTDPANPVINSTGGGGGGNLQDAFDAAPTANPQIDAGSSPMNTQARVINMGDLDGSINEGFQINFGCEDGNEKFNVYTSSDGNSYINISKVTNVYTFGPSNDGHIEIDNNTPRITISNRLRFSRFGAGIIPSGEPVYTLQVDENGNVLEGGGVDGLQIKGPLITQGYTVATLPAGTIGMMAYVTDADTPTYLGVLVGGGAVACPAFFDGTNWVAH